MRAIFHAIFTGSRLTNLPRRGRYIAYHSSTPHRRRAKPKVKVDPPPEEEHVDKELSGFMILEHDLVHGAVYIAVVMPWAISGPSRALSLSSHSASLLTLVFLQAIRSKQPPS